MLARHPWISQPIIRPPIPPRIRMGTYLCVMMASGRLISRPNNRHKRARPARQPNTTDNESNAEATRKCAEQGASLVGKRHRQHKTDIQRSKYYTSDQTEDDFRHVERSSGNSVRSQHLTTIR